MSRRRVAAYGALITSGILLLTGLLFWVQLLSCMEGGGSWVFRCWVFEEQNVPAGTGRIRLTPESEPMIVPVIRVRTHWHPLALAGWILPLVITLVATAVAVRDRNRRYLKVGAIAALVVLAFAFFVSPLIAWEREFEDVAMAVATPPAFVVEMQ